MRNEVLEYTFHGPKGEETKVITDQGELEARHLAMTKRWGPYDPKSPILSSHTRHKDEKGEPVYKYEGYGLFLAKVDMPRAAKRRTK